MKKNILRILFLVIFTLFAKTALGDVWTHLDHIDCTPDGPIPTNAIACPMQCAQADFWCSSDVFDFNNGNCKAMDFTFCGDRHIVAACTGAVGEYVCQPGYAKLNSTTCYCNCKPAEDATHCTGSYSNTCGATCQGTINPIYGSPVCTHSPNTGNVCDQTNCGQTITVKTAYCTANSINGCSPLQVPVFPVSTCFGCSDITTTCPACAWKEVRP